MRFKVLQGERSVVRGGFSVISPAETDAPATAGGDPRPAICAGCCCTS
jgi:hypothetical protein